MLSPRISAERATDDRKQQKVVLYGNGAAVWNDSIQFRVGRDTIEGILADIPSGWLADTRFDGPNRGDRFTGDVRIGQRYSARMIALPTELRDEYRDSDDVYYRYDEDRIYQVDRRTNLILRLLDLPK